MTDESTGENNSEKGATGVGPTATNEIEDLKAQVEKYKNEYLYLRADFDNFRKNQIKERSDLLKYGSERIVVELLNVLDNFERALSVKPNKENIEPFVKGVEMTAKEFKTALGKFGVVEVSSEGAPFDPAIHEALSSEPRHDAAPGTVIRVLRKPYKLHDRNIRPGQVVVSKSVEGN